MSGMWMSATRQAVAVRPGDARKAAADGKTSTVYPSDLTRRCMESRKDRSSSTIEMSGFLDATVPVRALRLVMLVQGWPGNGFGTLSHGLDEPVMRKWLGLASATPFASARYAGIRCLRSRHRR